MMRNEREVWGVWFAGRIFKKKISKADFDIAVRSKSGGSSGRGRSDRGHEAIEGMGEEESLGP
jgi:hypothetical protein